MIENGDRYGSEKELYDPMLQAIDDGWATRQQFANYLAEVTATGGGRATGRWSRPDITVVARYRYKFVQTRELEVITFEIKHAASRLDVSAVYEALAHRRGACASYLLIYAPDPDDKAFRSTVEDILAPEALEHGIGLEIATDPADFGSWKEITPAERTSPDLRKLEEFIEAVIPTSRHEEIRGWFN